MTRKKSAIVPKAVSEYMAAIGAKGGKKSKGVAKRRPAAHYRRLADLKKETARR